jgi:hypothetical protein
VTQSNEQSAAPPFTQLDFPYMPSRGVAADIGFFTDVLGGRLVFAVEGMGTRVAMIRLTDPPPSVLLADHVEGEAPVLVYRVPKLGRAASASRCTSSPGRRPRSTSVAGATSDLRGRR